LLVHGRWFSPGTPASSTTKTGRHDIAEILLKVALKHKKKSMERLCRTADKLLLCIYYLLPENAISKVYDFNFNFTL